MTKYESAKEIYNAAYTAYKKAVLARKSAKKELTEFNNYIAGLVDLTSKFPYMAIFGPTYTAYARSLRTTRDQIKATASARCKDAEYAKTVLRQAYLKMEDIRKEAETPKCYTVTNEKNTRVSMDRDVALQMLQALTEFIKSPNKRVAFDFPLPKTK